MSSVTAAASDQLRHAQNLDGSSVETVYRRGFSVIAMAPALLVALILAVAAFEHFRIGSISRGESIALSVVGPFVVVLALLWAVVVWYGTCVCLGETAISLHETSVFFRTRSRMVAWDKIKDISLSSGNFPAWRGAVILILSEGGALIIKGIPEPERLCWVIRSRLHG